MLARAAEPVVEIEMAERGVEVVAPQQADHPAAEPDAFRIAGRSADLARGFGEFVELAAGHPWPGRLAGLRRLVAGLGIAGLGDALDRRRQQNRRTRVQRTEHAKGRDMTAPVFGIVEIATDELSSLYNEWVSIATRPPPGAVQRCRTRTAVVQRRPVNVIKVPHLGRRSRQRLSRTRPVVRAGWRMHKAVSLFTLVAAAIAAAWWWLGAPCRCRHRRSIRAKSSTACPMRRSAASRSPLDLSTRIEPWQIDEDLAQLADADRLRPHLFGRFRPRAACRRSRERHGLKVLLGLWVSSHADRTKYQIDTGIALAKRFPDVVRAVMVGNEALLRGEIAPEALAELIRRVKSQVTMPVSYADVWEFWLRYRELASAVDFVTVHILPYWEDHPIAARARGEPCRIRSASRWPRSSPARRS